MLFTWYPRIISLHSSRLGCTHTYIHNYGVVLIWSGAYMEWCLYGVGGQQQQQPVNGKALTQLQQYTKQITMSVANHTIRQGKNLGDTLHPCCPIKAPQKSHTVCTGLSVLCTDSKNPCLKADLAISYYLTYHCDISVSVIWNDKIHFTSCIKMVSFSNPVTNMQIHMYILCRCITFTFQLLFSILEALIYLCKGKIHVLSVQIII